MATLEELQEEYQKLFPGSSVPEKVEKEAEYEEVPRFEVLGFKLGKKRVPVEEAEVDPLEELRKDYQKLFVTPEKVEVSQQSQLSEILHSGQVGEWMLPYQPNTAYSGLWQSGYVPVQKKKEETKAEIGKFTEIPAKEFTTKELPISMRVKDITTKVLLTHKKQIEKAFFTLIRSTFEAPTEKDIAKRRKELKTKYGEERYAEIEKMEAEFKPTLGYEFTQKAKSKFQEVIGTPVSDYSKEAIDTLNKHQRGLAESVFDEKPGLSSWEEYLWTIESGAISITEAVGITLLTGNTAIAAAYLSTVESSDEYNNARDAGKSIEEARKIAATSGIGTYLLEKWGLDFMFGATGASRIINALKSAGAETLQEEIQNIYQALVRKLSYEGFEGETLTEKATELFDGWWETAVGTALPTFIVGLLLPGVSVGKMNLSQKIKEDAGISEKEAMKTATTMVDVVVKTKTEMEDEIKTEIETETERLINKNIGFYQDTGGFTPGMKIQNAGLRDLEAILKTKEGKVVAQKKLNDALSTNKLPVDYSGNITLYRAGDISELNNLVSFTYDKAIANLFKEEAAGAGREINIHEINVRPKDIALFIGEAESEVLLKREFATKKIGRVVTETEQMILKELEPLVKEARKYKSAEEFKYAMSKDRPFIRPEPSDVLKLKAQQIIRATGDRPRLSAKDFGGAENIEVFRTGDSPIKLGDYVYAIREEAQHALSAGQGKRIYSKNIKANDLIKAGAPEGEYFYSPSKLGFNSLEDFYNQAVKGVKEVDAKTGKPKVVKPKIEKKPVDIKKIKALEQQLHDVYAEKTEEVAQSLYEIFVELKISEEGQRIAKTEINPVTGLREITDEWMGFKSTFPKWLPERMRSKKLFSEQVLSGLQTIESIKFPDTNRSAQRELYSALLQEVDSRVELDTEELREQIIYEYDIKPTEISETEEAVYKGRRRGVDVAEIFAEESAAAREEERIVTPESIGVEKEEKVEVKPTKKPKAPPKFGEKEAIRDIDRPVLGVSEIDKKKAKPKPALPGQKGFYLPPKEFAETNLFKQIKKKKELTGKGQALFAKKWDVKMAKEAEVTERINKTQIMNWAEKTFAIPLKGKVTHRWKAAGMYYPDQQIIRMQKWGELSVLSHEIAHHIDKVFRKTLGRNWYRPNRLIVKELADLDYDQGKRRTEEGFAEYMRYRMTTNLAKEKAPEFHKYFNQFLETDQELKTKLDGLKEKMDIWQKQGAENRIIQHIDWKGEHTEIKGIMPKLRKALTFINEKFNDEFYVPQTIVREIEKTIGKKLTPTKNPAIMMEYYKSKAGAVARTFVMDKAIDEYGNVVGSSLVEVLRPISGKEIKQFIAYAVSQRALNLAKRNIESGFDVDDAKFIVDKYKDKGWGETAKNLTDWSNHLLEWVIRAGGLDAKTAKLMRDLNPVYLPFKRAFIDEVGVVSGVGGYVDTGGAIKGIKGSGRPIINPVEAMIAQTRELIAKSQKIRIANLFAEIAEEKGVGGFITRVPAPMRATKFNASQIEGYVEQITGERWAIREMNDFLTVFTQDFRYGGKENIVSLWRNGEQKFYEIHPDLYESFKGIDPLKLGPAAKVFAPFARMLRLGATGLKLSFGLARNPFRDALSYVVFSKRSKVTVFDPIKGIYKDLTTKPGETTWRFKKLGGALSGQIGFDRAATQNTYDEILMEKLGKKGKALKIVKHPINALRDIISITEMGPRSAEIEAAYKKYTSEEWQKKYPDWTEEDAFVQAFNDAQDVTINFTKSGKWAKQINDITAFFNVAIRGPEKVYTSFRARPIQTFVKGVTWLTLLAIGSWYKNKDKDWYKNLPPAYKYNNLFFEIGNNVFRLPIPFELGMVFMSAPQAMLDSYKNQDDKWIKNLIDLAKSQIPNPTPSALQPAIDVMSNKNWQGIPIESGGMQYLYPTERKKDYTSKFAIAMSIGFNKVGVKLSPIQLDYLLDSYSGGFLRQFRISGDELSDLPVIGDLMLRDPDYPKRQLNEYFSDYETLKQKKQADIATKDELKKLKKIDGFYEYYKDMQKRIKKAKEKNDNEKLKEYYNKIMEKLKNYGYD